MWYNSIIYVWCEYVCIMYGCMISYVYEYGCIYGCMSMYVVCVWYISVICYACTVCVIWYDDLRLIYTCVICRFWTLLCGYICVYMWITMWITRQFMWITFCCKCNTFTNFFENIVFSHVFVHYLLLSLIYSCFLTFSLYRSN